MNRNEVRALLERMRKGDRRAYEKLYNDMYQIICSLGYSITLDRYLAEDIAQETFICIGNQIQKFEYPYNGFAWIYTIAKNIALSSSKKKNRETCIDELHVQDSVSFEDKIDRQDQIERFLSTLDEEERQIVMLHLVSDLKHKDIAQMLEIPLGTVLSKYNRSIKKIQASEKRGDLK